MILGISVDDKFVKKASKLCHEIFEQATTAAKKANGTGTFPVGMEYGFNEIVHRAEGRFRY